VVVGLSRLIAALLAPSTIPQLSSAQAQSCSAAAHEEQAQEQRCSAAADQLRRPSCSRLHGWAACRLDSGQSYASELSTSLVLSVGEPTHPPVDRVLRPNFEAARRSRLLHSSAVRVPRPEFKPSIAVSCPGGDSDRC
jgi:hypothetical protein